MGVRRMRRIEGGAVMHKSVQKYLLYFYKNRKSGKRSRYNCFSFLAEFVKIIAEMA